jgi:hypothetical protein
MFIEIRPSVRHVSAIAVRTVESKEQHRSVFLSLSPLSITVKRKLTISGVSKTIEVFSSLYSNADRSNFPGKVNPLSHLSFLSFDFSALACAAAITAGAVGVS